MTGIRTFLALPLEPELPAREKMQQLQKQMELYRIKWIHSGQFHLTLFFFGEVEARLIPSLTNSLQNAVKQTACFTYSLGDTGIFRDRSGPRVLWLGIEAPLGFHPDKAAFHPHITLGRFLARLDMN